MKSINEIVEILKRHKIPVLFFVLFVIVIITIIFTSSPLNLTPQTPNKVPYVKKQGTIELIRSLPENGVRSTFDSFEILTFEFSDEVNYETVDVAVKPFIDLKVFQNPEFANIINVFPAKRGWEAGIQYEVVIRDLENVSGERLKEPVTYTYINNPPDDDIELPF